MAAPTDDLVIGNLTKRIRLEKRILTGDGQGGFVITFALLAVVSAALEPLSNREALQASAVTSTLLSAFTTWYRKDISVLDRILLGTRTFQVESIQDPTGNQLALRLVCSEVQG